MWIGTAYVCLMLAGKVDCSDQEQVFRGSAVDCHVAVLDMASRMVKRLNRDNSKRYAGVAFSCLFDESQNEG